jgi:hypothetical protein
MQCLWLSVYMHHHSDRQARGCKNDVHYFRRDQFGLAHEFDTSLNDGSRGTNVVAD